MFVKIDEENKKDKKNVYHHLLIECGKQKKISIIWERFYFVLTEIRNEIFVAIKSDFKISFSCCFHSFYPPYSLSLSFSINININISFDANLFFIVWLQMSEKKNEL